MLEAWRTICIPGASYKIWDIRVQAVVWSIWNERNQRIFHQKRSSAKEVTHRALFFSDL